MNTGQEFLDDLWRDMAGAPDPKPPKRLPSPDVLAQSEWSNRFEQLMRNRLIQGAFRYGLIAEQDLTKCNLLDEASIRMGRYKRSRNLEYLVDAANMLLLAFVAGERRGETLTSIDDGEHAAGRGTDG